MFVTRNSAIDDKPRDAFMQMQWRGWPKTRLAPLCERPCVVECEFHQRVSSNGFGTVELQLNGSRISTYKSQNVYKLTVLLLTNFDI